MVLECIKVIENREALQRVPPYVHALERAAAFKLGPGPAPSQPCVPGDQQGEQGRERVLNACRTHQ